MMTLTLRQAGWSLFTLNVLVIALALAIGIPQGNPASQFGETKFVTKFSALQLLAVSWLAFSIFKIRRPPGGQSIRHSSALLWALIAAGFVFLTLDELLKIHERTDKLIRFLLPFEDCFLIRQLDELIVGLYGIIGLVVLWIFRAELKLFLTARPFFVAGFILLFAMIAVDMVAKPKYLLPNWVEPDQVWPLFLWLSALEESLKILGEAVFIVAFYGTYRKVKDS